MREVLLMEVSSLLHRYGFGITSFVHCNSCFDLAAKKPGLNLLIKILGNIDALRPESALELKKLAKYFNAIPLIVGAKSKAFQLADGIVYDRFGLNVVSPNTFASTLAKEMPSARYFKGKTSVQLDSQKLKEKRLKSRYSLNELAEKIGVTKESLYRYEKGVSASLEAGQKLESVLKGSFIKQINLFKSGLDFELEREELNDPAFEQLDALGLKLALFDHSPFQASGRLDKGLLIEKVDFKQELNRKALDLARSRQAFDSHAVILAKKMKKKSIHSTPIIEEEELHSLSKGKDLLKMVKGREK